MPIGVHLKLQAKGRVRVEGRRPAQEFKIFERDQLPILPAALPCEQIAETQGVRGVESNSSFAGSMGQTSPRAVGGVSPSAPSHRLAEFLIQIILQFHSHHTAQDYRGNVRIPRVQVSLAGRSPHFSMERTPVLVLQLVVDWIGRNPIGQLYILAMNDRGKGTGGGNSFSPRQNTDGSLDARRHGE